MRLVLSLFLTLLCIVASAQSKKQKKDETPTEAFYPQAEQTPKTSKKKSSKATYNARDQSFDRLEQRWKIGEKREKKATRNLGKNTSVDPYFGHKRKPKIRPIGKRKVCKVCGVTH
jgi:outer membrane protein assembly factor BamD (BamD/ComL family)